MSWVVLLEEVGTDDGALFGGKAVALAALRRGIQGRDLVPLEIREADLSRVGTRGLLFHDPHAVAGETPVPRIAQEPAPRLLSCFAPARKI